MGIDCYPYTTKEIKRLLFFRYGFYIALVIFCLSVVLTTYTTIAECIRFWVLIVTLSIYAFFAIGMIITERKFKKGMR